MNYGRHFEPGRQCEAAGCRVQTWLLWPAGYGLVRACTPAHADEAAQEMFDNYMAVEANYLDAEEL